MPRRGSAMRGARREANVYTASSLEDDDAMTPEPIGIEPIRAA
jgi:hypothetical protein